MKGNKYKLVNDILAMLARSYPMPLPRETVYEGVGGVDTYNQKQRNNQTGQALLRLIRKLDVKMLERGFLLTGNGLKRMGMDTPTSVAEPQRINMFVGRYAQKFTSPARAGAMDAYMIKSKGF